MKTIIKLSGAVLFVLLLVATVYLYRPLTANPSATELAQAAKSYQAEIIRDQWGVPHIKGKTDADASFALAYAHAEDDYQTIQATVAAGRGVLASYKGSAAAPTDYIVSLLDVWGTIDRRYDEVPADVIAIAEAYAAGLNLYAAQHPKLTWQGLAPFKSEDVVAGFIFKTPFFYGFDQVLLDLFDGSRESSLSLSNSPQQQAWTVTDTPRIELGSNAMAISAGRSTDNTTRLLINSHQPLTGPVAWYEAHLMSDEGLDITGGLFPGTPVILHGFNKELGWANTVNHIDLSDVYVLTRNPDNEMQYRLDGEWLEFEQQEVTINVKLWGPFSYPAKRRVLRTKHGPVIESSANTYAVRYAGIDEIRQLEQYYRLNKASSLDEFLAVMSMNALPSINYIYADKDSNIGFIHNAQYPLRDGAYDWSKDLPGDQLGLIWQEYRPFSHVPKLINPQSGLIFNANNTPYMATDGKDNLRASDFPKSMGLATNFTNRSLRLMEMNDGQSKLSKEDILRQKFDDRYSDKSDYLSIIDKVLSVDFTDNADLRAAQQHLKAWDKRTNIDNKHAALAVKFLAKIVRSKTPEDHSEQRLEKELKWTIDYLTQHFGAIDISWGTVNRLVRGNVDVALDGGPDILRAVYAIGLADDEKPYATNGDSWMALVEWDESGQQKAQVINQFGSAVDNEKSPHYTDQMPMFAQKKWRQIESDLTTIRQTATRIYSPHKPN